MTVGNGEKMKSISLGSIKGAVIDKKGQVITNLTLKDVPHTPELRYNPIYYQDNGRWMISYMK